MIKSKTVFSAQAGVILLLASIFALGGCGYKDKPVAPQKVLPKKITDLRHQLSEKGVTLFWSYPRETVTGDNLTDISEFVMYRAVVPIDSYCDSCPIPFGSPITLAGGAIPDEGGKTASYQATLLRPGNLYFFKVRSKSGWWAESADSNVIKFLWNTPLTAPESLEISTKDSVVTLSWQPVAKHLDDSPITEPVTYQVMRSVEGKAFVQIGEPVSETTYKDTDVVNGRKYFYQVQALSMYPQGTVGGGVSDTVAAAPADTTAPATPQEIRGIKTGTGIKIFWAQVNEKDLKGYRIYRRQQGNKAPKLIGEVMLPYTMYIDNQPPESASKLYYSVSSIDKQSPANESSSSKEIEVVNR